MKSFSPPSYFCPNIYQLFVFGKSSRKEQPTKNNWALWTLTLFQTYNFNYTRTNYLGSEIFFRIIQTASVQIKRTSGGPPSHIFREGGPGGSLYLSHRFYLVKGFEPPQFEKEKNKEKPCKKGSNVQNERRNLCSLKKRKTNVNLSIFWLCADIIKKSYASTV